MAIDSQGRLGYLLSTDYENDAHGHVGLHLLFCIIGTSLAAALGGKALKDEGGQHRLAFV